MRNTLQPIKDFFCGLTRMDKSSQKKVARTKITDGETIDIWGLPRSGKTVLLQSLCQFLANVNSRNYTLLDSANSASLTKVEGKIDFSSTTEESPDFITLRDKRSHQRIVRIIGHAGEVFEETSVVDLDAQNSRGRILVVNPFTVIADLAKESFLAMFAKKGLERYAQKEHRQQENRQQEKSKNLIIEVEPLPRSLFEERGKEPGSIAELVAKEIFHIKKKEDEKTTPIVKLAELIAVFNKIAEELTFDPADFRLFPTSSTEPKSSTDESTGTSLDLQSDDKSFWQSFSWDLKQKEWRMLCVLSDFTVHDVTRFYDKEKLIKIRKSLDDVVNAFTSSVVSVSDNTTKYDNFFRQREDLNPVVALTHMDLFEYLGLSSTFWFEKVRSEILKNLGTAQIDLLERCIPVQSIGWKDDKRSSLFPRDKDKVQGLDRLWGLIESQLNAKRPVGFWSISGRLCLIFLPLLLFACLLVHTAVDVMKTTVSEMQTAVSAMETATISAITAPKRMVPVPFTAKFNDALDEYAEIYTQYEYIQSIKEQLIQAIPSTVKNSKLPEKFHFHNFIPTSPTHDVVLSYFPETIKKGIPDLLEDYMVTLYIALWEEAIKELRKSQPPPDAKLTLEQWLQKQLTKDDNGFEVDDVKTKIDELVKGLAVTYNKATVKPVELSVRANYKALLDAFANITSEVEREKGVLSPTDTSALSKRPDGEPNKYWDIVYQKLMTFLLVGTLFFICQIGMILWLGPNLLRDVIALFQNRLRR